MYFISSENDGPPYPTQNSKSITEHCYDVVKRAVIIITRSSLTCISLFSRIHTRPLISLCLRDRVVLVARCHMVTTPFREQQRISGVLDLQKKKKK